MEYCTYILYSKAFDRFYIGHTNSLERRLRQHNESGLGWTKRYRQWQFVYSECFQNRSEAIRKEKYLKSLKNKSILTIYRGVEQSGSSRGS